MHPQQIRDLDVSQRHWNGVNPIAISRAREGLNMDCVDCGRPSLCGGLRCLPCFKKVAVRMPRKRRAECGTESGFRRHMRDKTDPCLRCRVAKSEANRTWRAA